MPTLREPVQALWHLDPSAAAARPLARSTWSDALASGARDAALKGVVCALVEDAERRLPDRLAGLPGLGSRPVRAIDGTYFAESAHYRPGTPSEGGQDNPKGHAALTFYNLRLGAAEAVHIETRSRHEIRMLRDSDQPPQALTRQRGALWLVDRAFIDAPFWDKKKRALGRTVITRMKRNLRVDSTDEIPLAEDPHNAGVQSDLRITLSSSREPWRLITLRPRRGRTVAFLTNDFSLLPGVVAFLYARRWDEEKCFDTWKNDLAQAKAWGKRFAAIENQVHLVLITHLLLAMAVPTLLEEEARDEKALRKQDRRQRAHPDAADGTDRPDWAAPLFRYPSKISRQVIRFFKHSFLKPASPALYERHLRLMLLDYL